MVDHEKMATQENTIPLVRSVRVGADRGTGDAAVPKTENGIQTNGVAEVATGNDRGTSDDRDQKTTNDLDPEIKGHDLETVQGVDPDLGTVLAGLVQGIVLVKLVAAKGEDRSHVKDLLPRNILEVGNIRHLADLHLHLKTLVQKSEMHERFFVCNCHNVYVPETWKNFLVPSARCGMFD